MSRAKANGRQRSVHWSAGLLRQAVEALYMQLVGPADDGCDPGVVEHIVQTGMQSKILEALRGRYDPAEAVRDLCTRCAFTALMVQGRPHREIAPLYQRLIQDTLNLITERAEGIARRTGENPLDEDPGLLISLCKCLSSHTLRQPISAHITWKLGHYEGAVSRAMRQIENLARHPQVVEAFAAHVLDSDLPGVLKAQLLQMARGGGRTGVNPEWAIRFFVLPGTVAFVKAFAGVVQTARTLYDEETYAGVAWRGKRKLPRERRQGYVEAARLCDSRSALPRVSRHLREGDARQEVRRCTPIPTITRNWCGGA